MVKIIGMMGLKGSGKNTVADIIGKLDNSYKTVAFADILKDLVAILFSWDRELLEGKTKESRQWREQKDEYWSKCLGRDFTPRMALQEIGTNVLRNHFYDGIWVSALRYKMMNNPNQNWIITDVRFKNEIDMLKSMGATLIRVNRGKLPDYWLIANNYNLKLKEGIKQELPEELTKVHPSEWDCIGYINPDYVINNDDTLQSLENNVKRVMELMKGNK